jgi:hypothetical protein
MMTCERDDQAQVGMEHTCDVAQQCSIAEIRNGHRCIPSQLQAMPAGPRAGGAAGRSGWHRW